MKGISMSRNVFVKNKGWRRIGLTEEETQNVINRVRWLNVTTMEQCLKDTELLGELSPTNKVGTAIALFEKLSMDSFTAIQEELANKAHMIKNSKPVIREGGDT